MVNKEAMKLALEALELHGKQYPHMVKGYCLDAITALREALAEQPAPVAKPRKQEPVAWVCEASSSDEKHAIDYWPGDVDDLPIGTKLYTSPPAQRTWVGLSPADRGKCLSAGDAHGWIGVMEATEARLKELNT